MQHNTIKKYLTDIQLYYNKRCDGMANFSNKLEARYLLANDAIVIKKYMQTVNNFFAEHKENKSDDSSKKLGIVIGNGYLCSILPEIPADDILLCDIDSQVHYLFILMRDVIVKSYQEEKGVLLAKAMLDEEIKKYFDAEPAKIILAGLAEEQKQLGENHFLSSDDRLKKCAEALLKKDILPININFFNAEQANNLALAIRKTGAVVSYYNMTNLHDYDKSSGLVNNLQRLPTTDNPCVIWTKIKGYPNGVYYSSSISDYENDYNTLKNSPLRRS